MRLAWSSCEGQDCLRLGGIGRALDTVAMPRVYPTHMARSPGLHQPYAGRFVVEGDDLCFLPRFPFVAGMSYTVVVRRADGTDELTITAPTTESSSTHVAELYPTVTELPRNHLKLYVQFSAPMSEGYAARHVCVVRAGTGEPLLGAFLPMEPELWDPARTRLTVLLDPARIKRGLVPHEQAGYPLAPGQAIEVRVDEDFRDAAGQPLERPYAKRYEVGADVRARVDPADWRLDVPVAGSKEPLVVRFDRPLDHALLQHCLRVTDDAGRPLAGDVAVPVGQLEWVFRPDAAWAGARHDLRVDPMLEDLAGNSVTRVFDRELSRPEHAPVATGVVTVGFSPAG